MINHQAEVVAAVRQREVTKVALAEAAGVHVKTLRGMNMATWHPRYSTVRSLFMALEQFRSERSAAATKIRKRG